MALKFVVDTLDGLSDDVKGMYQKVGDKYQLAIEGLPKPEDVAGLKSKVDELLREKKEEAQRRKEAEDAAEAAKQAALDEAAKKSGNIEALEKSWSEKLSKRERELLEKIDGLSGNINNLLVDNVASQLANEIGLDGSAALLVPHIKQRLAAEQRDGKFVTVVRDNSGQPSAYSLDDLKSEFLNNSAFAPVLKGSKATGGGASGSSKSGGAAGAKSIGRSEFEALNPQERMKFFESGGNVTD